MLYSIALLIKIWWGADFPAGTFDVVLYTKFRGWRPLSCSLTIIGAAACRLHLLIYPI